MNFYSASIKSALIISDTTFENKLKNKYGSKCSIIEKCKKNSGTFKSITNKRTFNRSTLDVHPHSNHSRFGQLICKLLPYHKTCLLTILWMDPTFAISWKETTQYCNLLLYLSLFVSCNNMSVITIYFICNFNFIELTEMIWRFGELKSRSSISNC